VTWTINTKNILAEGMIEKREAASYTPIESKYINAIKIGPLIVYSRNSEIK